MTDDFYENMGISAPEKVMQEGFISDRLKNRLWNVINKTDLLGYDSEYKRIWDELLGKDMDSIPMGIVYNKHYNRYEKKLEHFKIKKILKDEFCQEEWYNIYRLIQFVYNHKPNDNSGKKWKENFKNEINQVLEKETSAYRMFNGQFKPKTNKQEIQTIETACAISDKYATTKEHLNKAISSYANREKPDNSGSIVNSIHAVESLAKVILQDEKSGFSDLMAKLNTQYSIPKSLELAFKKLYGYASNEGGRHALKDGQTDAPEPEAWFILVTCSAMINFLIEKCEK